MNGSSLDGLRVIDASRVLAGPYCGQMLGDHGADVVKIEPPSGDETRTFGPPVNAGGAAYFQALNRNKRGVVLDLNREDAREVFWRMLETADVLIENFKASTLASWGIADPAMLCERFPRLIHCRITGFGDDGPLGGQPGYDAAVQAACGLMSVNGTADGPPLRLGVPMVDLTTGMQAAIAVLAALAERARSGRGQLCDVALHDCALSIAHPHLANYLWTGKTPGRSGNGHPNIAPYDAFETATVPVYVAVGNERQFATLCAKLGAPALAQDPKFLRNVDRIAHRAELRKALEQLLADRDGREVSETLMAAGVPVAPILDVAQAIATPHAAHRQMALTRGDYRGPGFPVKLSRTPAALRTLPPMPGEHSEDVLREAGYGSADIERLRAAGALGPPT
ncbi:CaiB/BaiF CoA-transferase family protein [Achromobacter sp. UMC46]|uniref:CaiB/BaiF CoA transferase family protein n=1 Tax=Achromobacter sp. UMC46 TaxID=1862319 RepID=UPI00160076F5|nr:CoA transferase [Achromobacter sp. UMC46]MBB1595849.1 carnitine dehydratase [Achromobacter sp. UMC46]